MDTSKEYIEMCKQAQEIQKIKERSSLGIPEKEYEAGDVMCYGKENYTIGDKKIGPSISIWLPRQDQLQEIMKETIEKKITYFTHTVAGLRLKERSLKLPDHTSIEQLWLITVMRMVYNKKWISTHKEWTTITTMEGFI